MAIRHSLCACSDIKSVIKDMSCIVSHEASRGVTEHYNPEEPEFTAESFGYDPLESTGREWYYHPVDEFIFQEYSDRRDTELIFDSGFNPRVFLLNRYTKELNAH